MIFYWFLLFLYMQFSRKANWKYWSFTKLNGMLHKSTKDFCCSPLTFTCIMCDVTNCSTDDICVWENLRKNIQQYVCMYVCMYIFKYSDDSLPCCCLLPEKSWKVPQLIKRKIILDNLMFKNEIQATQRYRRTSPAPDLSTL